MSISPEHLFGEGYLQNLTLKFSGALKPVLHHVDVSRQERERIYEEVVRIQAALDAESRSDAVHFVALPVESRLEGEFSRLVRRLVKWGARYLFRQSIVKRYFYE